MLIREFTENDWEAVKTIYEDGIATGNATFETAAPTYEKWVNSFVPKTHLVAEENGTVLGWCKLSPVSDRCVYAGVGEVSVYVSPHTGGKGVGSELMESLIRKSEEIGIWTINAGIFPENISSIALHKKFGFREVGRRERIGKMNGVWRDVLLFERRSEVVGTE